MFIQPIHFPSQIKSKRKTRQLIKASEKKNTTHNKKREIAKKGKHKNDEKIEKSKTDLKSLKS